MSLSQFIKQAIFAVLFILVASMIALGVNAIRPDPLPLVYDWSKADIPNQSPDSSGIAVWDLERLKSDYQKPGVVVLDARPIDFFNMAHIPGAKSLPIEQADTLLSSVLSNIPDDATIVTYCDGAVLPGRPRSGPKNCPGRTAERQRVRGWYGNMEPGRIAGSHK